MLEKESADPTTSMPEPPACTEQEEKPSSPGASRMRGAGAEGGEREDAGGGEDARECGERRRGRGEVREEGHRARAYDDGETVRGGSGVGGGGEGEEARATTESASHTTLCLCFATCLS
jgi:hypothetical protein